MSDNNFLRSPCEFYIFDVSHGRIRYIFRYPSERILSFTPRGNKDEHLNFSGKREEMKKRVGRGAGELYIILGEILIYFSCCCVQSAVTALSKLRRQWRWRNTCVTPLDTCRHFHASLHELRSAGRSI